MACDNLSSVLEMIRAELARMGHPITLDEMRAASLPARSEFGTRRIYVERFPKLHKLHAISEILQDPERPTSVSGIAEAAGCSEPHARFLRRLYLR